MSETKDAHQNDQNVPPREANLYALERVSTFGGLIEAITALGTQVENIAFSLRPLESYNASRAKIDASLRGILKQIEQLNLLNSDFSQAEHKALIELLNEKVGPLRGLGELNSDFGTASFQSEVLLSICISKLEQRSGLQRHSGRPGNRSSNRSSI